jgi:hypothetical protein
MLLRWLSTQTLEIRAAKQQRLKPFRCLYGLPQDRRYVLIRHIKATHESALGSELIAYEFSKWFSERGLSYANVSADFGIERLRMFMLTLGPSNFFRKYQIEPS